MFLFEKCRGWWRHEKKKVCLFVFSLFFILELFLLLHSIASGGVEEAAGRISCLAGIQPVVIFCFSSLFYLRRLSIQWLPFVSWFFSLSSSAISHKRILDNLHHPSILEPTSEWDGPLLVRDFIVRKLKTGEGVQFLKKINKKKDLKRVL